MARINLLPWRAERRKQQQREFLTIAGGSAFVMVLVILYAHIHISGQIDTQTSRNSFLQTQITEVESRIKEITELEKQKAELVSRMKVIERLQRNRPEIVHLFDELVRAVPDGLHLTSIEQEGTILRIKGIAQSNARVSALMRNLDASPYMENPSLDVIQTGDAAGGRKFSLTITQTTISADDTAKPEQKR